MRPDGGTLVLDITANGVFYGINNAQNRSMPHSINPNTARRNQGADMKTGLVEDNPQNNMATNLPTMWHRPTSMPPPSSRRLTGRLRCRGVGAGLLRTIHGFTYFLWSGFIWDIGNLVFSPNLLVLRNAPFTFYFRAIGLLGQFDCRGRPSAARAHPGHRRR